ncbi:hypothetical protein ACGYLO_11155 [Sulfitobacter sp. 1A13353]|uniref:hypothetical protein n=1 Tax=Sulfitobacter sp. 1A13353 TaxID=3368568 RepID=UPI003746B08A
MDKNTKLIIGGTAATAISFFLPWVSTWLGSFSPSYLLKAGTDMMTFGILLFIGSFILAAVTCGVAAKGSLDARLAVAAGALPFALAIITMFRLNSAASSAGLPVNGLGELMQLASFGMPVYFIGAGVALYGGVKMLKEAAPSTEVVSTAPEDAI